MDEVSGTTGITGSVDTILALKRARTQANGTLFITGRDVEEKELALSLDSTTMKWTVLGTAAEYNMSKERREILDVLADARQWGQRKSLTLWVRMTAQLKLLGKLVNEGLVDKPEKGKYTIHKESGNNGNTVPVETMVPVVTTVTASTCDGTDVTDPQKGGNKLKPLLVAELTRLLPMILMLLHSQMSDDQLCGFPKAFLESKGLFEEAIRITGNKVTGSDNHATP